ncbi:7TM GPCR, serpentine receptor class r (Str) family-containing protein [Aphelenchoides besseyi]|nr:7TM GPCR, serpentine receptor class r (Str) family-containing protein [Aphelenchoides besseyi]
MRVHCLSDMFYDAIQLASGVHAHPIGGKIFMMLQGFVTHVSLTVNRYLFDAYFWSLLFSIALLPIDFIYRYRSVCHNKDLSNLQLYLMVFLAYFVTWIQAFLVSFTFLQIGPAPDSVEFTRELQQFPQWENDVPSYSVTVLGATKSLSNSIFILCLNSFSYGIIIYTFRQIQSTLKENAAANLQNIRSSELQKQVSRILALQSILPLFVICLPVMLTVLFSLLKYDLPHFGAYDSAIYVWFSAVKPTATILIIPSYRRYVRSRLFGLNRQRVFSVAKSSTIPTVEDSNQSHVW